MNNSSHSPKYARPHSHRLKARSLSAAAPEDGNFHAYAPGVTAEMAMAARGWLSLLNETQQTRACLPVSTRIEDWHYIPRERPGLPLKEMNDQQSFAAWALLGTLLSSRGLDQARSVLIVEQVLGEITNAPDYRHPGNYSLVIFGDPAGNAPWAWRMEGHHLSLTVVIAPGHGLSVTPAFFGSNPAKVPDGHNHAGFRLLGKEEDTAFSLIQSLQGEPRAAALIANRTLGDIVAGPGRELSIEQKEGVSLGRLSEAQRDGVLHIAELFANTMREEIATSAMTQIREAGISQVHFAWAGSLERGAPHYFRIHGPTALIEYDNTQGGANHVHAVWIDPNTIFGRDLLRHHYDNAH